MRGEVEYHEGYVVFYHVEKEDIGYEKALDGLQRKINEAEKEFNIEFLSGVHLKDDQSRSGQGTVVACQSAVLRRRTIGTKREVKR
jgi:hypothetical protein